MNKLSLVLSNQVLSRFKFLCYSLNIDHFSTKGCSVCEWRQMFLPNPVSRTLTQDRVPFETETALHILGKKPNAVLQKLQVARITAMHYCWTELTIHRYRFVEPWGKNKKTWVHKINQYLMVLDSFDTTEDQALFNNGNKQCVKLNKYFSMFKFMTNP